ncbi:MAG: EpsI family protein, partial [candidate division WOR-3 bacterium]
MEKARIQASGFGLIAALLILTGALTYTLRYIRVQPDTIADFSAIPMHDRNWSGEEILFSDETYAILKATKSTMIAYKSEEEPGPGLFIAYFQDQKYGAQIHSPRHCLPGSGWGILKHTHEKIQVNGKTLPINRVLIGARENRQLMYYWFVTRTGIITSEFGLKFNLFMNALFLKPTDAAFV